MHTHSYLGLLQWRLQPALSSQLALQLQQTEGQSQLLDQQHQHPGRPCCLEAVAAAAATADPLLLPGRVALPLPALSFTTGRRPLPFLPLPGGPLPLLLAAAAGPSC